MPFGGGGRTHPRHSNSLGFNRATLVDYVLGSAFVLFSSLSLLPFAATPLLGVLVFGVLCAGFAYSLRGRRFWMVPALAWGCFISLLVGLRNSDVPEAIEVRDKVPLAASQLDQAPRKGPFLVSGAVLDSGRRGDWEECRSPLQNDPFRQPFRYNVADPKEVCSSAAVLALRRSDTQEVVAWVLRDYRSWPKFFDESTVFAFTRDLGGIMGSRSEPARLAREAACESWKKEQEWGEIPKEEACPADAPILWPVAQVADPVSADRVMSVSVMVWQIYSVFGWLLVGVRVLRNRIKGR